MFDREFTKLKQRYEANPQHPLHLAITKTDGKTIIFGAGIIGYLTYLIWFSNSNNQLFAFCDNHRTGKHALADIPIISPALLAADHKDATVIIAVNDRKNGSDMFNQLIGLGFPTSSILRSYGDIPIDMDTLVANYIDGYKWAYGFFQDEESKRIILSKLQGYLFGFDLDCSPIEKMYFDDDVIQLTGNEVFVDGGAYDGATTLDFIKQVNGNYKSIHAFEPDTENHKKTMCNLASCRDTLTISAGLWNENTSLSFTESRGIGSGIDANGTSTVPVVSLDEYFRKIPHENYPTFIKMDIEGAEKQALLGAQGIIRERQPKLAICVYHKLEDIYDLTQTIYDANPNYKLSLRHYTNGYYETILYATPD